ncbi:MAG: NnrU family protein [Oleiphilaceae bacterium]|nr:NnrU family protein [Oleiphilaceae bacterium]
MSTTQTTTSTVTKSGATSRTVVFAYSLLAYGVGMVSLVWLIACVAGLYPFGTGPLETTTPASALAVNAALIVLFGVQHSVMARKRFKDWLTRLIPPAAERSTYVLMAGVMLGLLLWLWQPMKTVIWTVENPLASGALWALFAFGWLYLVAATFMTNHFDLFGLRQAWLHLCGRPYTPVPFVRQWMYRYSRHPMMAGMLIGLWSIPQMQADHLALAIGLSAYIAIGIVFEERDLAEHFGEQYRQHCQEVGVLLPRLRR